MIRYDIYIYLIAIGLTPGGSSTSHIYTKTLHIIQRRENWEVRAVPRLREMPRQNQSQYNPGLFLDIKELSEQFPVAVRCKA
jgi:hypothetical protein